MRDCAMENDMDIVASLNEDQKVVFLKIFAALTAADGHVDDDEKTFVNDMARFYGIPQNRVNEIWKPTSIDALEKEAGAIQNRKAALLLIKEMCMLAHADDDLSDAEILLIGRIGEALGVSLEKIQEISNRVIDRLIWLEKGRIIFEEV